MGGWVGGWVGMGWVDKRINVHKYMKMFTTRREVDQNGPKVEINI